MSNAEKVFTYEEVKKLCKDAFDSGTIYGSESVRYGVDAVAYNWPHWLKEHDWLEQQSEVKKESGTVQISVNPFDMGTLDEKARKVCEEAMEFYAEHHECWAYGLTGNKRRALFYEIGDVLTAMLNYCNAEEIDPQQCINMVEEKNKMRGRYGNES